MSNSNNMNMNQAQSGITFANPIQTPGTISVDKK